MNARSIPTIRSKARSDHQRDGVGTSRASSIAKLALMIAWFIDFAPESPILEGCLWKKEPVRNMNTGLGSQQLSATTHAQRGRFESHHSSVGRAVHS